MSRDDDKDRADEDAISEAAADKAEADEADADEADADEADADEAEGGASEGTERDASTRGVAEALGVDEGEGSSRPAGEAAAVEEAKAPVNRAARRRDQAVVRRKKKSGAVASSEGEDDEVAPARAADRELPKDKNARAKDLLKRRQQAAASGSRGGGPSGLDTGEMVQDALVRGSSAAGRWLSQNLRFVLGGLAIVVVGASGFMFFRSREEAKAGSATGALAEALAADRGRVLKDDKRPDEEKKADPTRIFPTGDARAESAIEGYQKALAATGEPGPTTLARLGLAGAQLEKGDAQAAIDTYAAVLATPLASADVDVRGRSIEGTGLAKEAKGDLDGALASYEELSKVDAKGFEELGLYHQARVHTLKGDLGKAKELLKKAREKLSAPGEVGQAFPFLEAVVDGALRSLDPSAVPARTQLGGAKGSSMSPEELEKIQEQLRKALEKKSQDEEGKHEGEGDEHEGGPMAPPPQQEPQ